MNSKDGTRKAEVKKKVPGGKSPREREYDRYLRSDAWKERRRQALVRAKHRCQVCYGTYKLQVHHRTYDRIGAEDPSDLTVLCETCHKLFHKHGQLTR